MKDLYVILVNYNGWKDTINCINSIKENDKKTNIIVVDNNSTDESIIKLKKMKDIILIKSNENLGFAGGNNIGIKYALDKKAKYVMLLNNDTEIEKNAITVLKEKLDADSSLGIVGSRIMYYDNRNLINYCGGHINWIKCLVVHDNFQKKYENNYKQFFYTKFITGCSMMIRTEVFDRIGLLPEEYFMYFEDADFCVNSLDNGYKLGVCTDSIIYHKESASSGGSNSTFVLKWTTRNRIIFGQKYKKHSVLLLTSLLFRLRKIIKPLVYKLKGNIDARNAYLSGVHEGEEYVKIIRSRNEKN